uniref:Uncharacterized protein n=1 Tax=Cacopsylla melanoneura TaxID=428564 RepID=A0A8D9AS66_9HEMI
MELSNEPSCSNGNVYFDMVFREASRVGKMLAIVFKISAGISKCHLQDSEQSRLDRNAILFCSSQTFLMFFNLMLQSLPFKLTANTAATSPKPLASVNNASVPDKVSQLFLDNMPRAPNFSNKDSIFEDRKSLLDSKTNFRAPRCISQWQTA